MKRYVSVVRSSNGKTTVTVSLVDGTESAKYSTFTYTGVGYEKKVEEAIVLADKKAREFLEQAKRTLEKLETGELPEKKEDAA